MVFTTRYAVRDMLFSFAAALFRRPALASAALAVSCGSCIVPAQQPAAALPSVYYSDSSRLGRPYAKDPSVIRYKGAYWMYYSLPPREGVQSGANAFSGGWGIGVARSQDLIHWTKAGEVAPEQPVELNGIAAPGARVIDGKVHLFYQTYGHGREDAICHGVSTDGIHFDRDPSNPVYRPTQMKWSAGRAIDAEVFLHGKDAWLFFATRDPEMKVQLMGMAEAPLSSGLGRGTWHDVSIDAPTLKPQLPWEQICIEAPTLLQHDGLLYLFYAGAYNNMPQQIGVATSMDGKTWTRMSDRPLLTNGRPGTWNSSESGHPGVFTDDNGKSYLFFQGDSDNGHTWGISMLEIRWHGRTPYLVDPVTGGAA